MFVRYSLHLIRLLGWMVTDGRVNELSRRAFRLFVFLVRNAI
jgi:hypothetical protein